MTLELTGGALIAGLLTFGLGNAITHVCDKRFGKSSERNMTIILSMFGLLCGLLYGLAGR